MDSLPLYTIVVPAVVAGFLWGIDWRIWSREATSSRWLQSVAIPVAFVTAFVALWGWPGFKPLLAEGWLCDVALAGAVCGLIQPRAPRAVQNFLLLILDGAAISWIVHSRPPQASLLEVFAPQFLAFFLLVNAHFCLETISARRPGASVPLALWVWVAGSAVALAATGSIKYGQVSGILAATLGAATVLAWIKPSFSLAHGALNALMPLQYGIVLCGFLYSELPLASAILLGVAPLALWLGELNAIKNRPAWLSAILRAAVIAIPVGIALLIACWPMLFPSPKG